MISQSEKNSGNILKYIFSFILYQKVIILIIYKSVIITFMLFSNLFLLLNNILQTSYKVNTFSFTASF